MTLWEWPGDESHPILFVLHYFLQVSWLHNAGKEVVVVTSGAVAIGKLRVKQEQLLSRSVRHTLLNSVGKRGVADDLEPRACAAAGQAGLMALYETMFNQYGVGCAQVSTKRSSNEATCSYVIIIHVTMPCIGHVLHVHVHLMDNNYDVHITK
jgi:glutamate 5-kinase